MPFERSRRTLAAALGLTALALAACTPTESYWSEVEAPKQNRVEPVRLLHDVRVTGAAPISAGELQQLDAFISRHDLGYGDRVYILTDPKGGPTQQRAADVLNYMAAHGIKAVGIASPEAQPGLVRVVVNRYVVVPPNCPNWSKPATSDYNNQPMSNLGCATTANLGSMIADPSELIRGRTPGPADATGSSLAIQRYRAGKVTPLDKVNTTDGSGGGK